MATVTQRTTEGESGSAREETEATLRTLGEHLSAGQVADLAAALPDDLADALAGPRSRAPESFSLDEFLGRVGDRAGIDREAALERSRVVVGVLAEAVGEAEIEDTRDQLPDEFDLLFETGTPMGPDEFAERVQRSAGLGSRAEARDATTAVLRTLGERISEGEAADLATYLPDGAAEAVTERSTAEPADFGLEAFVRRVADREAVDEATAREHVRAVLDAVAAAASDEEVRRVRSQLPAAFDAVFEADEAGAE